MKFDYKAAIIIPVFKHSVLVSEAIDSALAQDAPYKIAIVLVDDGCPFDETHQVCKSFSYAYRNIYYIRKSNGGLSSARNAGIEYTLSHLANVEFIYFLDSDNRINPSTIRSTVDLLISNAAADWVYPNIDKMGIEWSGNYAGSYSKLRHVVYDNICEAGSLISRRIVDAGVRFDEKMKAGYEDWDFWLQCLDLGFRGINAPHFGLDYRQRAESMVRDSNRQREAILDYIRNKHKKLFSSGDLLATEHEEDPRYLCVFADDLSCSSFTDPRKADAVQALSDYTQAHWRAVTEPDTFQVPPFVFWMSRRGFDLLRRSGLANSVFLEAERLSGYYNFVRLNIELTKNVYGIEINPLNRLQNPNCGMPAGIVTTHGTLRACVDDAADSWIRSICSEYPQPSIGNIIVKLPAHYVHAGDARDFDIESVFSVLNALKEAGIGLDRRRWNWRSHCLPSRIENYKKLRNHLGGEPVTNRLKSAPRVDIGFVIPMGAFGGVEKVAYNIANLAWQNNFACHLFIIGSKSYAEFGDFHGIFETVSIMPDYVLWAGNQRYMGHTITLPGDETAQAQRMLGALTNLDIIIMSHVAPLNSVFGDLRRQGAKIVGHYHVLDETLYGRPAGHPYVGLAFEHAYDLLLTCSQQMADFLNAMGVPRAKIMEIPNAPSYEVSHSDLTHIMMRRSHREAPAPLRVLYLGRLDRQKGVDRLYEVIRQARMLDISVEWRVIGGRVVTEQGKDAAETRLAELGVVVEPPTYDEAGLTHAMGEADVLILLSRWEGAPLSVLEAQRIGCIPLVTDVGAVSELIEDGTDGYLLPADDDARLIDATVAILSELSASDTVRISRSTAAFRRAQRRQWSTSAAPLIDILERWRTAR
ncbi:glycosyltransferase [Methylobacterium sp. ID0610]|uniref:glycosyltransferase n=1 Tax=Methylobacterium carpenticola TaxID=3344827 RepID=UPI0036B30865